MLVSVIVPVYGVEKFVGKCIRSLLEQTYENYEIIVVDDKTPDNSLGVINAVLGQFPDSASKVKVLHHEVNKGLPAARNTGLKVARGEYVLHFDGDDFAEPMMLERMAQAALSDGADIVYSDWFLTYEGSRRYMKQPDCASPPKALEAMLSGRMKYNVWNKLVRRSLYTDYNISFPNGHGMGEDMTMMKLFAVAKSIVYLPEAFYCYVKTNTSAMTENISEKAIRDIDYNVRDVLKFLTESEFHLDERIEDVFKLSVKYPLLFTPSKNNYKLWHDWFAESNRSFGNPMFGFRTRFLQYLAANRLYSVVKIHYQLHSILYNILYRK